MADKFEWRNEAINNSSECKDGDRKRVGIFISSISSVNWFRSIYVQLELEMNPLVYVTAWLSEGGEGWPN